MVVQSIPLITDLRTQNRNIGILYVATGQTTPGDNNGGMYMWNASSTAADDSFYVIQVTGVATGRWLRIGAASNIYTSDGSIINNRTVTLNGFTLSFAGSTFSSVFNADGTVSLGSLVGTGTRYVVAGPTGILGATGTIPTPGTPTRFIETFTASAGQTTFNTANTLFTYFFDVYVNGVLLDGTSFTASANQVILTDPCSLNDIVQIIGFYNITYVGTLPPQAGNAGKFLTTDGTSLAWAPNPLGTVTSVDMSVPTGFAITGNPITSAGTLALGFAAGYSLPANSVQANWTTAYDRSLTSAGVTGTTTKTLTLNQQDGGTITATWSDFDTAPVTSVFGRTGDVVATEGDYTLTLLGDATISSPANGQVLRYNGTSWVNSTESFVGTVTSVSTNVGTTGTDINSNVVNPTTTPTININVPDSSATTRGALTSTDWTTFNNKQAAITLTTVGSSGAATFIANVLNIPDYGSVLTGYVPTSRTLTINGTTYDLTANRSWSVGTVTSVDLSVPTGFAIANNPITGSGTLALTFASGYSLPTNTSQSNWNDAYTWVAAFPSQTGNNGKYLTTNGSVLSWSVVDALPSQTGNAGKYLTTDGSIASWVTIDLSVYALKATTLTINGNTYDLSANRTWSVGTVTSIATSGPLTGGTITGSGTIGINQAGASSDGYLSSTDWTTFNAKQPAGNYITSLTGEATASGPGAAAVTLTNSAVIGKVLTGLNVTGGSISASDSILAAFGKIQNQINGLVGGLQYQGTWNANTNTPTLTSSVGTNGYFYIVDVAGSTNLNGITDWKVGDWAVFSGTSWQKVDNTESVTSVNGFTGAVSLTTSNISEGTNLYFTDLRARQAISLTTTGTSGAATYDNTTGVLNIPQYQGGVTSFNTRTGAITLLDTDVTGALGYTPVTNARTITINGTSYDLTANRTWSVGTVTSVDMSVPTGFAISGNPITGSGTLALAFASGYALPTTASQTNWDTAYTFVSNFPSQTGNAGKYLTTNGSALSWSTITLSGYVPYTGATQNVNLGEYGITSGYYAFDLTPTSTPTAASTMYWDDGYGTANLILKGGNTTLNIGQQEYVLAYNDTVSTMTKGQVVYISGAQGNRVAVKLADNSGDPTSAVTIGFVAETITAGGEGYVITSGALTKLNTTGLTQGAALWLGATPGTYTQTKPVAPNHAVLVGYVERVDNTVGSIFVKVQNGYELGELHDVYIPAPTNNNVLVYESSTSLWKDKSIATILGYTPVPSTRTLTINSISYDLSADRSWTIGPTIYSRGLQKFTATAGQTTFTITNGYTVGLVDVFRNGVKLDNATEFTASNGTTVVLTDAAALNDVIEVYKYGSEYIPNNALRTVNTFTATASQTTFSVTYSVGLLDVFYNGAKLAEAEYTATNGTSVVLAIACAAGDIVEIIAYSYLVNAYSGISGTGNSGYIPKFTSATSIGNSLIQDNGTTITLGGALNGTIATFSVNQNADTIVTVSNTTAGTGSQAYYQATSDTTAGYTSFGKTSSSFTTYKILTASSGYIYNSKGDIAILNDSATGAIKLTAGGSTSAHLTIASTGAATFSSSVTINSSGPGFLTLGASNSYGSVSSGGTNPATLYMNGATRGGGSTAASNAVVLATDGDYYISNANVNSFKMFVSSSGNVGIGETSPSVKLQVGVSSNTTTLYTDASYALRLQNASTTSNSYVGMYFASGAGIGATIQTIFPSPSTNFEGHLTFSTRDSSANITERMRITSGGNVGIGITSDNPIANGGTYRNLLVGNGAGYGAFQGVSTATATDSTVAAFGGGTTGASSFKNAGSINIELDGTSTTNATGRIAFYTGAGGTITEKMRITSGGNVLVGRTDSGLTNSDGVTISDGAIQAEGNSYVFYGNRTASNGLFMGIRRNNVDVGDISVTTTATTFNTSSDYRLKQDFKEFNGLDIISKIKPYDFSWKIDNSRMYGVIAHELQEILPYAVTGIKDGEKMQSADYSKLTPVLVKAIQELSAQVEELKNK